MAARSEPLVCDTTLRALPYEAAYDTMHEAAKKAKTATAFWTLRGTIFRNTSSASAARMYRPVLIFGTLIAAWELTQRMRKPFRSPR